MSNRALRSRVIRFAHARPELRRHLLPLLKQAKVTVVQRSKGGYSVELLTDCPSRVASRFLRAQSRARSAATSTEREIERVLEDWSERKKRAPEGPHWFPPRELFKYREFIRPSRPDLSKSMRETGFDVKHPIRLTFGRNGVVKIDEGNHRLRTAIELRLPEVPVVYRFVEEEELSGVDLSRHQQKLDRDTLREQQKQKRQKTRPDTGSSDTPLDPELLALLGL